jgi:hypothetical protein
MLEATNSRWPKHRMARSLQMSAQLLLLKIWASITYWPPNGSRTAFAMQLRTLSATREVGSNDRTGIRSVMGVKGRIVYGGTR